MTEQKKSEKSVSITISSDEKMPIDTNSSKNVGYGILKTLYKQLELDKFWNWKTRNHSAAYSVDQIFRLLIFFAHIEPCVKKENI
jgi:hypothetical protein